MVEIGCPAEHDTHADRHLPLPNDRLDPERDFHGQRFVHHVAGVTPWAPSEGGLLMRDSGVSQATGGLASVVTVRLDKGVEYEQPPHRGEFFFLFVIKGVVEVVIRACPTSSSSNSSSGGGTEVEVVEGDVYNYRLPPGSSMTLPSTHHLTATAVGTGTAGGEVEGQADFLVVQLPQPKKGAAGQA